MSSYAELASRNFLSEWMEVMERDRNHPSIITWAPFNAPLDIDYEMPDVFRRLILDTHKLTKAIDSSRPFNDITAGIHFMTDIWSISNYAADAATFTLSLMPGQKSDELCQPTFLHQRIRRSSMGDIHT